VGKGTSPNVRGVPAAGLGPWTEADLGTTDTRYEGTWDAEHTIWPASYTAKKTAITLDGDLGDWDSALVLSQVPFYPYNAHPGGNGAGPSPGGELREFDEHSGGIWNGVRDQASACAFAWDDTGIYQACKVVDDTHQCNGNTGWDGDTVQVIISGPARDGEYMQFNNYGLSNLGDLTKHHISGADESEAVIVRNEQLAITIYEMKYPISNLGVDAFTEGFTLGLGYCVNDGDTEPGQGGQKGWSGWAPYAIVYGFTSSPAGLVILAPDPNDIIWTQTIGDCRYGDIAIVEARQSNDNAAYDIMSLNYATDLNINRGLADGVQYRTAAEGCAGDCTGNGNSGDSCGFGEGDGGTLRNDDHRCPSEHHDEVVSVKLSATCDTSSFAIYGADRTVAETNLRHIRVAYSTDGTSWTCYVQSNDDSQGGTPSFATASDNCDEGPSHAASGSVFNIPAPAMYVSFAFWGWTDVTEIELKSCTTSGHGNYDTLTDQDSPEACVRACAADDRCNAVDMFGTDAAFTGECWLFDANAGVHSGDGTPTSACWIQVDESPTVRVGAGTSTDPNGIGMWWPTYEPNLRWPDEASLGTTDTRYAGTVGRGAHDLAGIVDRAEGLH
jgi:hypothetical protein